MLKHHGIETKKIPCSQTDLKLETNDSVLGLECKKR
jgi:hypothetical protein